MNITRALGMDMHRMSQVVTISKQSGEESGVKTTRPDLAMAAQDSVSIRFAAKGFMMTPNAKLDSLLQEKAQVSREAVDALIQAGAALNGKGLRSPLFVAVCHGQVEAVKYFIEKKVDLNKGPDECTPLHRAIRAGHSEIVKLLLEAGANIHLVRRWGGTPLADAASVGDEKTFDLLLSKGADPKALGEEGKSMLFDAVEGGNLSILKRLLAIGLDPNKQDSGVLPVPVLMRAVENGQADMVEALLDAGANAKTRFLDGSTVLHMLGSKNTTTLVDGTKVMTPREKLPADTPERRANLDKIVKRLVAEGLDINSTNEVKETPLFMADGLDVMEVLLQNGANVNAYNAEGFSVLDIAQKKLKDWQLLTGGKDDKALVAEILAKPESRIALLKKYGAKEAKQLNLNRVRSLMSDAWTNLYVFSLFLRGGKPPQE